MKANFATWSLRNPVPAITLFVILTLAGLWSFPHLVWKNMPDFEVPTFVVAVALPGASAVQLETEVAKPVEDAIAVLPQVEQLRTEVSESLVVVKVDFALERDSRQAYLDLKAAMDQVRAALPAGTEEPRIRQHTLAAGAPTVTVAVTSDTLSLQELSWFVQDTVLRQIVNVPGVARIDASGEVPQEIAVEVDPVQLDAHGVTATEVREALSASQQNASGGRGRIGMSEEGMRTLGAATTLAALKSFPIVTRTGQTLRLNDVAEIKEEGAERIEGTLYDGKPAVAFEVLHNPGFDEIALTDAVRASLDELQRAHPEVSFHLVASTKAMVDNEVRNALHMLIEGALLAVVVIWLFLRDWRSTAVGALALPLSIVPSFAFLYLFHITLNTISTLALMMVVGVLVDDAIVEVENINRHLKSGVSVLEATALAVTEIGPAVIATTLALVVVFLPMSYMGGFSGLAFRQFGWTAVIAVSLSLLVARLLTPVLAAKLLRPARERAVAAPAGLLRAYLAAVRWCLQHKALALLLPAALLALAIGLWNTLPAGFIPDGDDSQTTITLKLPPGSTLAQTLEKTEQVRALIAPLPGVEHVLAHAGQPRMARNGATGGGAQVGFASLLVTFASWGHRASEDELEAAIHRALAEVPGVKVQVNGSGYGTQLHVILAGKNPASLKSVAHALEEQMQQIPGLAGVTSSAGLDRADIVVRPDAALAAAQGVSTAAIGETLRIATGGDYSQDLPKFDYDSHQVDIRVRLSGANTESLAVIRALKVPGREGLVPLEALAQVGLEAGPLEIDRVNRQRHITVSADLSGMPRGEALARIAALPVMQALPADVRWLREDATQQMDDLFVNVGQILVVAAILVYCLLAVLFKNFFVPLTILSAVPLCASGALAGVYFFGGEIDEPVLLGFIFLLGILTKNSILLTDYALMCIEEAHLAEREALIAACEHRVRPILMTTCAMIAGMLPSLIGWGQGDMTYTRPLAATVIGGLAMGTLLSLLGVPVVFVYVRKLERACTRKPAESHPRAAG